MDNFQSDYIMLESPSCALPDLRFVAYAAGLVVVVLALGIVAVKRLRTW
jgi:hypothetical protein